MWVQRDTKKYNSDLNFFFQSSDVIILASYEYESTEGYSWVWLKGVRTINDNGTGQDKNDDRLVSEEFGIYKKSEKFDSYYEAFKEAEKVASDYSYRRTGPPPQYYYDKFDEKKNYIEVNIFINLFPVGNGTTNENYEANRWMIIKE